MRWSLSLVAVSVLAALACGGSSAPSKETTEVVVVEAPPSDLLTAGVHFGSELCTKKMGDNCENPATTFAPDTPLIYFVHQTKDIPASGDTFTIKWVATDVGAAAPAGTVIAELNPVVDDGLLLKVSTHYTISSELSIPDAGWPVGSYVVDVSHNGVPMEQVPFQVE